MADAILIVSRPKRGDRLGRPSNSGPLRRVRNNSFHVILSGLSQAAATLASSSPNPLPCPYSRPILPRGNMVFRAHQCKVNWDWGRPSLASCFPTSSCSWDTCGRAHVLLYNITCMSDAWPVQSQSASCCVNSGSSFWISCHDFWPSTML